MAPAFIVDGLTEKKVIQRLCQDSPIRMTNLNGKNVETAAIAKAVSSLISLFRGRHFPVFVIVDREGRVVESIDLERAILEQLREHGISDRDVIVACPDRMIENWMLGDVEVLRRQFGVEDADLQVCYEGRNGKSELRDLLRRKQVAYHELTVGVEIFKELNPHRVCENAASFARFQQKAEPYCRWLRRIR